MHPQRMIAMPITAVPVAAVEILTPNPREADVYEWNRRVRRWNRSAR